MIEKYKINGVAVTKYSPDEPTDKAPIIMVHGGDHGAWGWEKWATFFSESGYEVHVPDWYNHGESDDLPEEEFTKRSIVDVAHREIRYIADKLDRQPILIGHSMGGLAATAYACEAQVERLVLIAPVMTAAAKADPIPLPVDPSRPMAVFPYPQAKQLFFTRSSEEDATHYYGMLEPESSQAVIEATQWQVELDLAKINVPTYVLATEFDQLIPQAPLERYAELLNAKFDVITGVGHSDVLLKEPEWRGAAEQTKQWLEQ